MALKGNRFSVPFKANDSFSFTISSGSASSRWAAIVRIFSKSFRAASAAEEALTVAKRLE